MTVPLSDHFNGKTFFNPRRENRSLREFLRWRRTRQPTPWPAHVALTPQPPPPAPSGDECVITWIGHATFLVQTTRGNFLTDPNYSERCGPFGILGPGRVQPPGIAFDALPHIDFVLLSHDHYDHCDVATLRALAQVHDPLVLTPLGNRKLVCRAGSRRVTELDWWQANSPIDGIEVILTPARHWSNRLSGRRNARLWGGFFVRGGAHAWWFAGDTGYDHELFHDIRSRLGAPDIAMVPIGAYEPRWFMAAHHCNPAEAVQIHRDVGAGVSLAMHWGAWQLTDEGRDDPVNALASARRDARLTSDDFRVLAAGETLVR